MEKKKLNKCFFMSSGTESTEAALKLMRLNGIKKSKKKLVLSPYLEIGMEEQWGHNLCQIIKINHYGLLQKIKRYTI